MHLHSRCSGSRLEAHGDGAARGRVAQRILYEIVEHVLQQRDVAKDERQIVGMLNAQDNAGPVSGEPELHHDVMGEIGVAVVVPADPSRPPDLDGVRAFLAPKVARYKIPEALRLVDELPLTPMQKIDRRALAATETSSAP